MFRFKRPPVDNATALLRSNLYDERSFYYCFLTDMQRAKHSIIIESPFITRKRLTRLMPAIRNAVQRGVAITINTRHPECHEAGMEEQAAAGVAMLQAAGITVLYTGNHHRKIAIIDSEILWEGSLNILSQSDSCEVMRRIFSAELADEMIRFTGLERWYTE